MRPKSYYLKLRERFTPKKIRCIIIAESPPCSEKYFYDDNGSSTESLFIAFMKMIRFKVKSNTKKPGLEEFKKKGFLLLDASYEPINCLPEGSERDNKVKIGFSDLLPDLKNKKIPILLIKKNVCVLLNPILTSLGFDVINKGKIIPFPSNGNQIRFHKITSHLFKKRKFI